MSLGKRNAFFVHWTKDKEVGIPKEIEVILLSLEYGNVP